MNGVNILNIGVSTACFYPKYTEKAVNDIINMGVDVMEIFFNSDSELCDNFINKLNFTIYNKCKVVSIHPFTSGFEPFLIFSKYDRRFKDAVIYYNKYFKAAKKLGSKIIVLHGDLANKAINISDELYFERYKTLYRCARKHGIYLAQENVNLYKSQSPKFIKEMSDYLKNEVRFVFDIKQSVRAGFDPFDMLESMGEKLIHIHINDHDEVNDCLLPGDGKMDYKKLNSMLKYFKYNNSLIIEVYRSNFDNINQIKRSVAFLKEIFCTV